MTSPCESPRVPAPSAYADLMEQLVQGLYALGLRLEYCISLIDESPEQARAGLDAAITRLGEEIDLLRPRMRDKND